MLTHGNALLIHGCESHGLEPDGLGVVGAVVGMAGIITLNKRGVHISD